MCAALAHYNVGDLTLRDGKPHAEKHGLSGAAQEIAKAKTHRSPLEA